MRRNGNIRPVGEGRWKEYMMRLALICLIFSTTAALAQVPCPVCDQALRLQAELKKFNQADQKQIAQAEALSREALKLVETFGADLPSPKQGAKAFEALVRLGIYASAFTADDEYARALAVLGRKNPAYRKQYQAMIRKGLRAKDRQEMCRVRYLQTSVTVKECELDEARKGADPDSTRKRCSADFGLQQCLEKR
jgi:hypothetical protein